MKEHTVSRSCSEFARHTLVSKVWKSNEFFLDSFGGHFDNFFFEIKLGILTEFCWRWLAEWNSFLIITLFELGWKLSKYLTKVKVAKKLLNMIQNFQRFSKICLSPLFKELEHLKNVLKCTKNLLLKYLVLNGKCLWSSGLAQRIFSKFCEMKFQMSFNQLNRHTDGPQWGHRGFKKWNSGPPLVVILDNFPWDRQWVPDEIKTMSRLRILQKWRVGVGVLPVTDWQQMH